MAQKEAQQYLIFSMSGRFFGTKLKDLIRVIPCEGSYKIPLAKENFVGIVRFEGKVIPLFNLGGAMKLNKDLSLNEKFIAVERLKGENIGLLIGDVHKVVTLQPDDIKDAEEKMAGVKWKATWDGKDIFLLDPEELIFGTTDI